MEIKKTVLSNGLRLITTPIPGLESASCVVSVGVGSRYEKRSKLGISHVLEHMAFKGTTKRPQARDIATLVEGVGGVWNASTGKEVTSYWIKLAGDHLGLALDVLSDIILNSILDKKELKKEIGVVMEEGKKRRDDPETHIFDMIEEQVFGDQPIGWDTIGTTESLQSITRDDLVRFISEHYRSENIVVSIAGKVTPKAEATVGEFFNKIKSGSAPTYEAAVMSQSKPRVRLSYRKTEQAHLALGLEALHRLDQDHYPLKILDIVLGEGMSSRLFTSIREQQGLAYRVSSDSMGYHDTGIFVVYAGVSATKVDQAISSILEELHQLTVNKVSQDELGKAKELFKGRLLLSLESTSSVANSSGRRELLDKRILTVEEIINLVDRVTAEDILRVAKRLFRTEKLNLSLIGPFKDENRFLKLLKIQP